jgi:hypothetical protein
MVDRYIATLRDFFAAACAARSYFFIVWFCAT